MSKPLQIPSFPVIRIQENSAVIWSQKAWQPPRSDRQKENAKNLTRGLFNGFLSTKAKVKIKKILRTWLTGAKLLQENPGRHKLVKRPYHTFVTLTLSSKQKHCDLYIRRHLLNAFIQQLERKFNVWHHFYVAEKQLNGNIHFHLLIDSYIHWRPLRNIWNKIQNNHGYIEPFRKVYGHSDPNSTDIHGLRDVKDVSSYVVKYMTTDKNTLKLKGRIWGCSDQLRKLKPYETIIDNEFFDLANALSNETYFEVQRKETHTLINGPVMRYIKAYYKSQYLTITQSIAEQVKEIYKIHPSILAQQESNPPDIPNIAHSFNEVRTKKPSQLYCPF